MPTTEQTAKDEGTCTWPDCGHGAGPAVLPCRGIGNEDASLTEKAREILADYDAGRPLQVDGDGWLVRFAAHIAAREKQFPAVKNHSVEG